MISYDDEMSRIVSRTRPDDDDTFPCKSARPRASGRSSPLHDHRTVGSRPDRKSRPVDRSTVSGRPRRDEQVAGTVKRRSVNSLWNSSRVTTFLQAGRGPLDAFVEFAQPSFGGRSGRGESPG